MKRVCLTAIIGAALVGCKQQSQESATKDSYGDYADSYRDSRNPGGSYFSDEVYSRNQETANTAGALIQSKGIAGKIFVGSSQVFTPDNSPSEGGAESSYQQQKLAGEFEGMVLIVNSDSSTRTIIGNIAIGENGRITKLVPFHLNTQGGKQIPMDFAPGFSKMGSTGLFMGIERGGKQVGSRFCQKGSCLSTITGFDGQQIAIHMWIDSAYAPVIHHRSLVYSGSQSASPVNSQGDDPQAYPGEGQPVSAIVTTLKAIEMPLDEINQLLAGK